MGSSIPGTLWTIFTAVVGVVFIAVGLQGYMFYYGKLNQAKGVAMRLLCMATGLLMMIPERVTDIIGCVLAVIIILGGIFVAKKAKSNPVLEQM